MTIPEPWNILLIGRKIRHPKKPGLMGVVAFPVCTKMGHDDPGSRARLGVPVSFEFAVDWDDGTSEDLCDVDILSLATDEFVREPWVHPMILALQKAG
jgi:hypothetical protein